MKAAVSQQFLIDATKVRDLNVYCTSVASKTFSEVAGFHLSDLAVSV